MHLGARPSVQRSIADPLASHVANTSGIVAVLEPARRFDAHVVVASSSSVYGATATLTKSEDLATRPMSPDAASKLAAEADTNAYGNSYGMNTLTFRFFNVFGPLQAAGHAYAAALLVFIDAALDGRSVTVHGDGTQSRDFTFVDTVTEVIADAVVFRLGHADPVNLGFGLPTDLLGLLPELEEVLVHPVERQHISIRAGDVPHSHADGSTLKHLLPDVEPVDFSDGLRPTVVWMRATRLNS